MEQRTVATHHSWAVHTWLGLATAFMGMPALVLPAPATSYWDLLGSSSVWSACAHCIWLGFTAALPGVALCDEPLTVDSDSCLWQLVLRSTLWLCMMDYLAGWPDGRQSMKHCGHLLT